MPDAHDHSVPKEHHVIRIGHWMSQDRRHHHKFLQVTVEEVDKNPKPLNPAVQKFKDEIEKDTRLYMLFTAMLDEVPSNKKYLTDPTRQVPSVRDFDHLCKLLNHVLTTAPRWTHAGHKVGLVGVPVNALLDWPMGTNAGFAAFQDPKVNALLKDVLNEWGKFLSSPESAEVLGDHEVGWLGPEGRKSLESVAHLGAKSGPTFDDLFQCEPEAPHKGYKSWDDFFTRLYRDGVRPIAEPENDNVIANACESKVYNVAHNVSARERFWIKGQPYSVMDMLAFDDYANQFVGGTVYQAFLSALSYHRWHSPVTGTIKKVRIVDGTYYSEPLYEDFSKSQNAPLDGENTSQEFLSAVATRGIIFIEADNPKIGLIAFIAIGMVEVSTCDATVKEGQKVKKGDQLGMFHFGGSTHCVLFRKGVNVTGFPEHSDHNVPVRSRLCVVE